MGDIQELWGIIRMGFLEEEVCKLSQEMKIRRHKNHRISKQVHETFPNIISHLGKSRKITRVTPTPTTRAAMRKAHSTNSRGGRRLTHVQQSHSQVYNEQWSPGHMHWNYSGKPKLQTFVFQLRAPHSQPVSPPHLQGESALMSMRPILQIWGLRHREFK